MLKDLQLENSGNKIINFRRLSFNKIFACILSILGIWIFNTLYQNDNLLISIIVYLLLIFFILRQLLVIGIVFQNTINQTIDFSLDSKGWKVKKESEEDQFKSRVIYTNTTDLKWVNNVEIVILKESERTIVYCNTYSLEDVISIFHFIDEQKLLNDLISQK